MVRNLQENEILSLTADTRPEAKMNYIEITDSHENVWINNDLPLWKVEKPAPRVQPAAIANNISSNVPVARAAMVLRSIMSIENPAKKEQLLQSFTSVTKPTVVSFVNAHALNIAWENAAFAANLTGSDIVLRDGIGVSVLMRFLKMNTGVNMNGTDLIPEIVPHFAGKKVAICGTAEPYLTKAAEKVQEMGGNVVLIMDGFQAHEEYVKHVSESAPDLVILGMGMPKQEAVSMLLAEHLKQPVVIVNGGAILDFWANRFPRAPRIWQALRLEWLFRMLLEPRRLWRRYLLGGAIFVGRLFKLRVSGQFKQNA